MDRAPPAHAVFGLLSDDTRVEVLEAIARAQHDQAPPGGSTTLSFSGIYDRVDVDGTSKLSYHLGELEGCTCGSRRTATRSLTAGNRSSG